MRPETRDTLNAINQRFYLRHAGDFDRTRRVPWPGWKRACEHIPAASEKAPARVLDAGSGNGRFSDYLGTHRRGLHWLGMDLSLSLLALAAPAIRASSLCGDLGSSSPLPIREGSCRAIAAFGLFHHIASYPQRLSLLARLASHLEPQGRLLITHWQFADEPSIASRILPWGEAVATGLRLDPDDLDPGDHLLGWGDEPSLESGRYCHHVTPLEASNLVRQSRMEVVDEYFSDGRTGRLNLYQVLRRAPR